MRIPRRLVRKWTRATAVAFSARLATIAANGNSAKDVSGPDKCPARAEMRHVWKGMGATALSG